MADPGPVTCAGCGLLCDDVTIDRAGDTVRLTPECHLGAEWFTQPLRHQATVPATVDGRPADIETALRRAAELLRGARRPLLYGFHGATVEDARAAVALADRLGALISTEAVDGPWPGASAIALRGASTATLGEIRDRSQLVVVWREDPESTHPRLLQRLGFGAAAAGAGAGAPSSPGDGRTLAVVDDHDTATGERADVRLRWGRERDLQALVTLHALARGLRPPGGGPEAALRELSERIDAAGHLAFVYGPGLAGGAGGQRRALALHELVRALSPRRHAVTLALAPAAGITGAQAALTWQTGYRGAVDLAPGHPEPVALTRPLASEMGVDVALRVEGLPAPLPAGVAEISLGGAPARDERAAPEVTIRTAVAGVQASGTLHRLDGVPLTLPAPFPDDAPAAAGLLARLLTEVAR